MRGRAMQREGAGRWGKWRRGLWAVLVTALLLGAVAPGVALAQEDKEETEVQAFKREKQERQKAPEQKGPNFKAKAAELKISLEGDRKRDEAIRLLKELIEASDDTDPEKPKYLFQLAESLWAKSKYHEQKAYRIQDDMYAAQDRKDRAAVERYKRQMQDELKEATRQREEAVKVYVQIINNHPSYEKIADVYFYLGINLIEIGKRPQALGIFKKLLQEYPTTEYTPNVLLAFGEYYFDNDDMDQAMKAYSKVLEFPQASIHTYATYKLAWCHYNLTSYDKALNTFLDVVKATSGGKKKDQALRKEALRDVVLTYSHIGKPSKALGFFKKLVREESDVLYMGERLAQIYADNGQFRESTALFRELIKRNRSSYKIVSYQLEIIRNVEPSGDKVEVVREILRAAKLLDVAAKFKDADAGDVKINRDKMELILREYATTYHREAQKTRSDETYALAYELYKQYLDLYPESPDRYVMTFFYAELLYRLKKYDEAAERYQQVTQLKPEGQYSRESAHGEVLSLQKLIEVDDSGKTKGGDVQIPDPTKPDAKQQVATVGPPAPKEIPALKQQLIDACDRYAKIAPDAPSIVKVKYTAAWVYYDHLHLDDAISRFAGIVEQHTSHRLAIIAADLHLDSLYLKKDYEGLTNTVEVYRSNDVLGRDSEFITRLDGIAERLQFQRCFDMEGRKEWEQAARCFTQVFYRKFPDSPLVDKALYNAALDYERVRQVGKAIQVRKGLLQLRPDSPLAPDTLFNIGGNYHAIAVYSEASKYYELFVQHFAEQDPKKAEEALRSAATFRQGLGQYQEAVENYERYLDLFSDKKKEAAEVKFQIARIYDDEGKKRAAFDSYNEYLKKWAKVGRTDRLLEAHMRIGMIHWESRRQRKAFDEFKRVLKIYNGLRDAQRNELTTGADAAAQARFMVGEVKLREMESIKLKLPEKLLQKRLVEKIKKLDEAAAIYKSVFKFGRPDWTLAALYRIGYVAQSFANEIRNSPVPKGLSYEQEELYKGALEEQASQIEGKAIESYTECLNVARQKSWFNEYSTKAEIALAGLQPKKYRKPSELRAQPDNSPPGFSRAGFVEKATAEEAEQQIGSDQ